jgi:hypothetical protein
VDSQTPPPLPDTSLNAPSPPAPFRLPADYYASPPTDVSPLFPRWVPVGCGLVAIAILVLLFAGGAMVLGGRGGGRIVDFFFESVGNDLREMTAKDVAQPDRDALEAEMKTLRKNIDSGRVGLTALEPLLKAIGSAVNDNSVRTAEIRQITGLMHQLNSRPLPARSVPSGVAPAP